jgi:predicted patatin/cPLA2 family phospholipase
MTEKQNINTTTSTKNTKNIKHLVLSGGGLLGISYIGLLKYLEESHIIGNLKSISGSSAGSFFGCLIALGYTSKELEIIVKTIKFKEYVNINAESLINFMRTKGLESGTYLINLIKKCIKDKTGDENITFNQVKEKYKIELQIGVTNLSKYKFELLNSTNSPDVPIYKAIRASTALPFIFEPYVIGDDVYCDGGLLDNFPIDSIVSDAEDKDNDNKTEDKDKNNVNILGIYLINQINPISKDNYQSIPLLDYVSVISHSLACCFISKKMELDINTSNKRQKIIIYKIPCDVMTFIKINASLEDINNIIEIAYNTTKKEMEK